MLHATVTASRKKNGRVENCCQLVLNNVFSNFSAYKILLQSEEDRLTVVVNQGLLTLSDVRLNLESLHVNIYIYFFVGVYSRTSIRGTP